MVESVDAAGLPTALRPVDYLMYRREASPRIRLGFTGLALLDATPDWGRFRDHYDNASRRVLRMRQKVVVPTLPTTAPRWVVDPDFNLDFHVRRVRVPEPGTLREVFDLAEVMLQSSIDISRPLWMVILFEGLADGRAATLFHMSHAVTDGVGGVGMLAPMHDFERDPPIEPPPPPPPPQQLSSNDLMREGIKHLPRALIKGAWGALWGALSTVGRVVLSSPSALAGAVGHARSLVSVMSRAAEPSPLLRQRSPACRSEVLDMRLSDLHKAAKAGGGSINDAYLAGLCGALGRYHEALGVPIATLPMGVPVSLRAEADAAGGNRVTVVNLAAPAGTVDPVARMREIRAQMTQRREETARDISAFIAPLLNVLPVRVLEAVTAGGSLDVVASNVPCYQGNTYIAGAKMLRQYGLGPLTGAAMVVNMLSMGGWCTVTVRYDRAAVRDEKLFAHCLREGFDEILALAGEPAPRAVPAWFALDRAE